MRRRTSAHPEQARVAGHLKFGSYPDEAVAVEQLRREPVGVRAHPADRPEHGVGRRRRLPGAPLDRLAGDLITRETVGYHRTMPRVELHPGLTESALHALPRPGVMFDEGAIFRKVQLDPLPRPGPRDVDGAADRGRAAA